MQPVQCYCASLNNYIGFYEPFRHALNRAVGLQPLDQMPVTSIMAGAASGAIGGQSHLLGEVTPC